MKNYKNVPREILGFGSNSCGRLLVGVQLLPRSSHFDLIARKNRAKHEPRNELQSKKIPVTGGVPVGVSGACIKRNKLQCTKIILSIKSVHFGSLDPPIWN